MRLVAVIGALVIVVAIGAAVYFFGGFYSVAATEEIAPVAWILVHVRQAPVDRHATEGSPTPLDNAAGGRGRGRMPSPRAAAPIATARRR